MPAAPLPLLSRASIRSRVRQALDTVAERLGHPLPPEDVHQLRRAIKQLRAWCRLLEADGQPGAQRLQRSLRELAAHYGAARDAKVHLDTLATLEQDCGHTFPRCRQLLASEVPAEEEPPASEDCAHYHDTLRLMTMLLDSELPSPAALQRGLLRSHRKTVRSCRQAWHSLDSEDLHELRKRVKTLANQYALCVDRRGATGKFHRNLVKVGSLLGNCHDLSMLRDALGSRSGSKALLAEIEAIITLAEAGEQALWPECMELSEDCFPGKVR